MLAFTNVTLALKFFASEVGVFMVYKIVRGDFYWWIRVEGVLSVVASLLVRVIVKVITDFTGCVHFRNPLEMGGLAYSASMLWAQIMPFVALGFYEGGNKEQLEMLLLGSFGVWAVLNVLFFCSIDRSFVRTFFTRKTGPQYIVELFRTSTLDSAKFRAAFSKRRSYIAKCEDEVRAWMEANYEILVGEEWFRVELVPDDFLPKWILEELNEAAAGGVREKLQPTTLSTMKEVVLTLTTVDTVTDVYMIYLYKVNGLHSNANTMIAMIATNVVIQLGLVLLVLYKKKGWKTKLKEVLITILFLRPFVDAWRVNQKRNDAETMVESRTESMYNKIIELVTESIPGCVLQCYVLLLNPSLGSSR